MASLKHIKGLDEFKRALEQLPKNIGRNVLRGAVNAGATKIRQQVRHLAPVLEEPTGKSVPRHYKGQLRDAIYQAQIPELSNELVQTFFVGVRRGKKKGRPGRTKSGGVAVDAYYWTWLEFGHYYVPPTPKGTTQKAHREAIKAGSGAVWVQPRSFMRPGFMLARDEAINAMVDYLANRIPKEAQKLGIKTK